jgi:hypothetical protein
MAWRYLTEEQKQQDQLYSKFTAFKLFMILLYISLVITFFASFGANFQLESMLLSMTNTYTLKGEIKTLYSLSNYLGYGSLFISLILLLCISNAGKTKNAVKIFIAFLIITPVMQVVISIILQTAFIAHNIPIELITRSIGYIVLYAFFGVIFAIYYFFSKAFNLQYLSRIKI